MKAFIALFILNSFPQISADDSNPFDGVDPATIKCDEKLLTDAGVPSADRWAAAGAEWALEVTNVNWGWYQGTSDAGRLAYSEFVSNSFNAKEMMLCQNMGDGPCMDTVTCNEVNQPAGYLILNSFAMLHMMHRNIWESLESAMNKMQNSMSLFQTTFSPAATPKSSGWLTDMITVFQFVVGIGSAFTWNIVLKDIELIANAGAHAFAQEAANGAIGMAFTLGKSHLPSATGTDIQNDLTLAMGVLFDSWIEAETDILTQLFSGTNEDLVILQGLVNDGLALDTARHIKTDTFTEEAQKIVYSQLLPIAWRSSGKQLNAFPGMMMPMIMMVADGNAVVDLVPKDDAGKMSVSYDGHKFFVGYPIKNSETVQFYPLPGGTTDELDGTKWGGITIEDMVISAYEGWRLNGGKMGYEIPENSKIIDGAGTEGGLIFENGVRTPGFVKLPICTWAKVQSVTWEYYQTHMMGLLPDDVKEGLPCGDGSLMEDEMGDWGF
ncbi:hypothetical protein G7Z17_g4932 [Cylindrodendrum hubeiense]|uniref:Uncharacterized protein n=1 Tax=Cylindrodendrum hubeiense TaxID=595255 RepID=A0A9P5H9X0_9HYPO|nr:hypothetical protein G7Z17_g4932 [Cylindrodendrum hubeiense]